MTTMTYRRVELPLSHPGFRFDREVLCSLSIVGVHCRTLALTLGLSTADLTEILRELRREGYKVRRGRQDTAPSYTGFPRLSGHYAWVDVDGWVAVKEKAEEYWASIYGE